MNINDVNYIKHTDDIGNIYDTCDEYNKIDVRIYHMSSYDYIRITSVGVDYTKQKIYLYNKHVCKFIMDFYYLNQLMDTNHQDTFYNICLNDSYTMKYKHLKNLYNYIEQTHPSIVY